MIVPDTIRGLAIPGVTYCKLRGMKDKMEIVIAWRRDDRNTVLQRFVDVAVKTRFRSVGG